MDFLRPLVRGRLVQRYKRFFADVILDDGTALTAHVPNPGAMLGLKEPGLAVWLSRSDDPKRKLAHTLEMVELPDGAIVGVNTMNPNRLAAEAIEAGLIPELAGYPRLKREVAYDGDSRIDILLSSDDRPPCWVEIKKRQPFLQPGPGEPYRAWVEVKNCHFSRTKGVAEFPDCVTDRATKHLGALARMVERGDRAVLLFVIQRDDCDTFTACHDLDPKFSRALEDASDRGVEVLAYSCAMSPTAISIERRISWSL